MPSSARGFRIRLLVELNIFFSLCPLSSFPFWSSAVFNLSTLDLTIHYRLCRAALWLSECTQWHLHWGENGLLDPLSGWAPVQIIRTLHPWCYCSSEMLPLRLFDRFHPAVVSTALTVRRQCQQTPQNLVKVRAAKPNLYSKTGSWCAD